jgi:hypothetical protein
MTARLMRFLLAIVAGLIALASANVTMAATLADKHQVDAAPGAASAAEEALPDPGNLTDYRDRVGQTFVFTVTGATDGTIYGDGVYTDDSPVAVAAVHAGVVSAGDSKDVHVMILPGQQRYKGTMEFGVSSSSYGAWQGSYKFLDAPMSEADMVFQEPGNLSQFRGKVGKILKFQITGSTTSQIWGDGVYTDDSDLDTAAVHAGVLEDGQSGTVSVKFMPGQGKYAGADHHGVSSVAYGHWDGSFEFVDPSGTPILPKGR